jgi:hypothetical protein
MHQSNPLYHKKKQQIHVIEEENMKKYAIRPTGYYE